MKCYYQLDAARFNHIPAIPNDWIAGYPIALLPKKLETLVQKSKEWMAVIESINKKVMPVYLPYKTGSFSGHTQISAEAALASVSDILHPARPGFPGPINYNGNTLDMGNKQLQNPKQVNFMTALNMYNNAVPSSSAHPELAVNRFNFAPAPELPLTIDPKLLVLHPAPHNSSLSNPAPPFMGQHQKTSKPKILVPNSSPLAPSVSPSQRESIDPRVLDPSPSLFPPSHFLSLPDVTNPKAVTSDSGSEASDHSMDDHSLPSAAQHPSPVLHQHQSLSPSRSSLPEQRNPASPALSHHSGPTRSSGSNSSSDNDPPNKQNSLNGDILPTTDSQREDSEMMDFNKEDEDIYDRDDVLKSVPKGSDDMHVSEQGEGLDSDHPEKVKKDTGGSNGEDDELEDEPPALNSVRPRMDTANAAEDGNGSSDKEDQLEDDRPAPKPVKRRRETVMGRLSRRNDVIGRLRPPRKTKGWQRYNLPNDNGQADDELESEEDPPHPHVTPPPKQTKATSSTSHGIKKSKDKGKQRQVEDDIEGQADNEETSRPVTPPPRVTQQPSSAIPEHLGQSVSELQQEASSLLRPNSFTSSGLECSEALVVLGAVLGLSPEGRGAFLSFSHAELLEIFEKHAKKRLMKHREVDHMRSPAHKRTRRNP